MNKLVIIIVALMLTGTVALADDNMITSKITDVSNNVKTFVINETVINFIIDINIWFFEFMRIN